MQDNSGPAVATTLRAIAAWLESHPEIQPYQIMLDDLAYRGDPARVKVYGLGADEMAQVARTIGGRWEKRLDAMQFTLGQQIAPHAVVELTSDRERVCTRVVTGTTTIEEPDPEALAQVPTVTREVETYEWVCAPLLGATS